MAVALDGRTDLADLTMPCPACAGTGQVPDPRLKGQAMRALRQEAKISMRELSKRTGFSLAYLHDLELGRRNWRPELEQQIREALKRKGK